jgi:His/Glu/Gln/Arg/opine family amino acid ABC transporter permease subunit
MSLLLACLARPGAAESALDQIRARGKLVIGCEALYPPFEVRVGDRFEGFDIDLGNEIGKELGVAVQWVDSSFDGLFPGLTAGQFDLLLSGITITEERKQGLAFSRPYFLSGQTIVVRRDDDRIRSSADLPGHVVGVQQATTGETAVQRLRLPEEQIRKFKTLQAALMEVVNRNADAAVGDEPALLHMLREGYPGLKLVGGVFVEENLGVVVHPDEPELLAAVNQALDRIIVDGRYARIYQRWIGQPPTAETMAKLEVVRAQGTPEAARAAGGSSLIRWDLLWRSLPALLEGARLTLYLAIMALLLGVPAGLLIALARLSGFRPLVWVATVYVEVIRGTPLLMQILAVYFVLPSVGLRLPPMAAAVTALSLNAAAYIAEIFRAGIQSIDRGQMEAALAVGMSYTGAMRWVILPQTFRRTLPPLTNEGVALLKDTSLVSAIALAELTHRGNGLAAATASPVTFYLAVALLYLAMTLPLTHLVRRLEHRWQPVSRPRGRKGKT